MLPSGTAFAIAVPIVFFGGYWGHRLSHTVPFLWRFHAVHHSIDEMDWLANTYLGHLAYPFTGAANSRVVADTG